MEDGKGAVAGLEVSLEPLAARLAGKRVLVTGHTGFKGSWCVALLRSLGAIPYGLALDPETDPALFDEANIGALVEDDCRADIRDPACIRDFVEVIRPDVVLHMAAQALVRRSYREPSETFHVNVQGTAAMLEAVRAAGRRVAVVVVTSDKVYANDGRQRGYLETDRLGGTDPYSASKAACELVVNSYRTSFFPPAALAEHGVMLATDRAGNVIGGGDWSEDRLLPDLARAWTRGAPVIIRNAASTRPWQHVLDPLVGYLMLAARLLDQDSSACRAWNFGPDAPDVWSVGDVLEHAVGCWPEAEWTHRPDAGAPPEHTRLTLDSSLARLELGWATRWRAARAIERTLSWYQAYADTPLNARALMDADILAYGSDW